MKLLPRVPFTKSQTLSTSGGAETQASSRGPSGLAKTALRGRAGSRVPAGALSRPGRTRRPRPPGHEVVQAPGGSRRARAGRRGRRSPGELRRASLPRELSPGWSLRRSRPESRAPVTRGPGALAHLADCILFPPPATPPRASRRSGLASRNPVRAAERAHWPAGAAGLHKYMVPGHGAGQGESAAPAASLPPSWTPPFRLQSWK